MNEKKVKKEEKNKTEIMKITNPYKCQKIKKYVNENNIKI